MSDWTGFQSDLFYRKRGTAADEFGKLGSDFGYEEDSEVKSILVSRVEDMKKKASAIDAMMSICKVGMEPTFEVERDGPVQRVLQGRHQLSPGGHRPFARRDFIAIAIGVVLLAVSLFVTIRFGRFYNPFVG